MLPADPLVLVVVPLGALLGGLASGLTGFAFAATTLGLYGHVLAPSVISPLMVGCSLIVQLVTLPMMWRRLDWRAALPFLLAGLAGVPLGVMLLTVLSPDAFRVLAGAVLILYAAGALLAGRMPAVTLDSRPADAAVGLLGGVLGGFAGLSGVLPTIWCSLRRWTKDRQRSVFQLFNTAMHVATLGLYGVQGRLTVEFGGLLLLALPGLALGGWLGFRLYRRIDDRLFARVLLALLGLSGITMVAPAVAPAVAALL